MVSWLEPGYVSGYGRAVGAGIFPTRAVWSTLMYRLATAGSVDANLPSRFQHAIEFYSDFAGQAAFRFTAADVAANPGRRLSATAYLAPASAFGTGVVPTPAQIRTAATMVTRAFSSMGPPDYLTTAGDLAVSFYFTDGIEWEPNKKWWLLVAPTSHAAGAPATADTPVGDINVNGRAVSSWTNRTPTAPVITSPVGQSSVPSGSYIDLRFNSTDPDRIASFPGDVGINDFDDVAGVQIQYAPMPTASVPDPDWVDLPISWGSLGDGWYIESAQNGNSGAIPFWRTHHLKIFCGATPDLTHSVGYLPSGDWQVRVRTFDYGHNRSDCEDVHPYLDPVPPLADYTGLYTPDNYPEANTSPWSTPVRISVSAQVPKPIALSPTNGVAIVNGEDVTLAWQYRNTFVPPYPQDRRTVEVRLVGITDWFPLVEDEASTASSYTFLPAVSGNTQYAWRVRVRDASGVWSDYSDPAFFWIVPEPASGDVIPDATQTIDEATLGCGTHRVEVYRRGGKVPVGEIRNVSSVEWGRVRDDISVAKIVTQDWDVDCGNLLASLEPWAYEIVLFRDNGYTVDRVWEGPITLLTYETNKVTIQAKDVMAYAYRRIIKQAMTDSGNSPTAGSTVVSRAVRVLQNAFAPDDPNVLAYLQAIVNENDAKQYRSTPAYSRTAFEEVDDMAANAGLDYTAVGRAILVWGTKNRIATLPEFRDEDLGNAPIVSVYGMSMANVYAVSDGNGIYGEANRLDEDGEDKTYGLVEMLSSTWASDASEDTGTYTQEGIATVRESFVQSAERSIASRYPPPVVVRVPDNTRLNPDTVLSIQHLVPGVVIPLRSETTLRSVRANQKLDAVKVVETKGSETISITLSPFSRDDTDMEETE